MIDPTSNSPLDDPARELVGHLVHHVDALRGRADLTGVDEGPEDGASRRPNQIGVGTHDHRVLPAELERARDQPAPAGLRHLAPGAHAAGERDLVDVALHQGGAGLAVAENEIEHALRQAGLRQQRLHQASHPDHPERPVGDLELLRLQQVQGDGPLGQDALRALHVELGRVAG
jgi:hypothetical protein